MINFNSESLVEVPVSEFDLIYSEILHLFCTSSWNKHVSYNFNFISTSNCAGALEIAEPIVNELNDFSSIGAVAFDSSINEEVLFMMIPLCFLADSPMAAEITNTPNPGSSNSPCRMYYLMQEFGLIQLIAQTNFGRLLKVTLTRNFRQITNYTIRRYVTAILFADEKFESYNGIIRKSSIHSNHHIMRCLVSGAPLCDYEWKRYFKASNPVAEVFESNMNIQACGYNNKNILSVMNYPCIYGSKSPLIDDPEVPQCLKDKLPGSVFRNFTTSKINPQDFIRQGAFVVNILLCLNVQHNFFDYQCQAMPRMNSPVGRQEKGIVCYYIYYTNTISYLFWKESPSHPNRCT
ncbi:hypothetical protein VP01_2439g1 [Puccinia sorghi]|uniref:Uncharacterized protein n=1 Tax=Puccinia sorghi TaxID=27349 RepID=A0A0L6V6Z2_9BASI|nr:hypothetical protein VP01_2439g1 [Puccinia sorghi]